MEGTAAAWPLFAGLGPLGALPTAPRLARVFTGLVLPLPAELGMPRPRRRPRGVRRAWT
jgi:hypothetical protein